MPANLKVIITKGLPASGKSTFAREWVKEDPEHRVQIEKDQIRLESKLFEGGFYNHKRGDETIVIKERDRQIESALSQGKSVIVSDTNLVQKHISKISSIARKHGATVEVKSFLDVPLKTLIDRDAQREEEVGEQVIRRMFHEQVKTLPTFLKYDPDLPWLIVSDLDGTLTKGPKNRSPFEWHKVGQDDINLGAAKILDGVNVINQAGGNYVTKVFIFSGRDEVCRPETEDWLDRHCIDYDALYMRRSDHKDEKGNQVSDVIVKSEMIEKYIKGKYNVLMWLDDRVAVANMLRDVYGINVAQFGDPNHRF